MKTKVLLIEQRKLTVSQKERMWEIYQGYFNHSRSYFTERMSQNTHFSLYFNDGKIDGFTGLRIDKFEYEGRKRFIIYYGPTLLPPGVNGALLMPSTASQLMAHYWKELMLCDSWIWFDALSYKPYLVASKNMDTLYPSIHGPIPQTAKRLIDHVGVVNYGASYCPLTGTVTNSDKVITRKTCDIYPRLMENPDVAFFAKANPGWGEGNGLLTFMPLDRRNIYRLYSTYFKMYLASWKTRVSIFSKKGHLAFSK